MGIFDMILKERFLLKINNFIIEGKRGYESKEKK